MYIGLLSSVSDLTSTTVNSCTLHFTWIAPNSLEGVPINYTIDIKDTNGMLVQSDTTSTTEYFYSVSRLGETLEVEVTAVNGAGAGNATSIMTQTPSSSETLLHVDLIAHVCMNIVSDMKLMNTLRTNSHTNTNWTYIFDFEVIILLMMRHGDSTICNIFLCRKHLCVQMLSAMLLLKHV